LRRYHESEIAYRQTIRAFSGIIEVAGFSASGHAAGTADIATGMSRLAGLAPGRVDRLEQAALLHDVGLITLSDPGVASAGHTDEDIAVWGAAIIAEADELGDVADIVRSHARQYRQRGEETDRTVSTEARFLKAASAYDRTIRSQGASPSEALEFLHLNTSYDFDPAALRVLRRFLVGRGELADTS
jgi:HD-GYP domain-containing protein (c-di-GMP phosphodiesterase class II)